MEYYTFCVTFLKYLCTPDLFTHTPEELVWVTDTDLREYTWQQLEKLSLDLYKKIEKCLSSWNHQ